MWTDYAIHYLFFVLQALTIVVAIVIGLGLVLAVSAKARHTKKGRLSIHSLNACYQKQQALMAKAVVSKSAFKKFHKQHHIAHKKCQKTKDRFKRVFVIDFSGDIRASQVEGLTEEVNAILSIAEKRDEVVVRIQSPGGVVNGYGLAAAQLARIKEAGIHLVAAIDQVAASGGYMMASVADQIIASPFAVVGSIGVVAELPNIHRLLEKKGVDIELHTAGKYKRTLTVLGENTEQGREKFKQELEVVHRLFKTHIAFYRPSLKVEEVATGEYWYGKSAIALNLVDHLLTSDAYLLGKYKTGDYQLFSLEYKLKKSRLSVLSHALKHSLFRVGL